MPSLDLAHPVVVSQKESRKDKDQHMHTSSATVDPVFFNNSFFLSGSRTFQDHVFSGWLTKKSKDAVLQYEQGIKDGTLHAEWKDEEWERDHPHSHPRFK